MAPKQRREKKSSKSAAVASALTNGAMAKSPVVTKEVVLEDHLPPLALVFTILICSGIVWVLGLRDLLATGKPFLGAIDDVYLEFTKSTQWFDDSKGWKSTQGGVSAVQAITTDENNMGGFFVRKLLGAGTIAVHLHKLMPLLFHPNGAQWKRGHFRPLLASSVVVNTAIVSLYAYYLEDFQVAGASAMPMLIMTLLGFESLVMMTYLFLQKTTTRGPAVLLPTGKNERSVVSRIVARTVMFVGCGVMTLIAGRDLLFSGQVIPFIPRDDIYLEWTGAFLHSPPEGSVEAAEHGIDAPFYIGDKIISQLCALMILCLAIYKFTSSFLIQYGSDGSGLIKTRMFWKSTSLGGGLIVFVFRLFHGPAKSASLDLRWHLMIMAYEAFILGLFAFV